MSTSTSSASAPAQSKSLGTSMSWASLAPQHVDRAAQLPEGKIQETWNKMYALAECSSKDEAFKMGFRFAAYEYGLVNGTSRAGDYAGELVLFDGTHIPAAVIPQATGVMQIRKFFRSNMGESYKYFKDTARAEALPDVVSKAAKLGIPAADAFAMADWMTNCPKFTPGEQAAHTKSFNHSLMRSRAARGGASLENVEDASLSRGLSAQVMSEPSPGGKPIDF